MNQCPTFLNRLENTKRESVVLLHGIMRSKMHMKGIESVLKKNDYQVINIDYPSTRYDISSLSDRVWEHIKNSIDNQKVHFVGYSMGGLVAKMIIDKYKPKNLGRVVLIGTPNHGSEIADFFKNNFLYKKVFGPAGQELVTHKEPRKYSDENGHYELGCIASTLNGMWRIIYPLSYFLIKSRSDGRVSLESTAVETMKERVILSCPHFFLPYSKKVKNYILSFLKNGNFINL